MTVTNDIKLPTDEEIKEECRKNYLIPSDHLWQGFVDGAKWAREKVLQTDASKKPCIDDKKEPLAIAKRDIKLNEVIVFDLDTETGKFICDALELNESGQEKMWASLLNKK